MSAPAPERETGDIAQGLAVLLVLAVIPVVAAGVVAAGWMGGDHVLSSWWGLVLRWVTVGGTLVGLGAVREGHRMLRAVLGHWPAGVAGSVALLVDLLALAGAVTVVLVLVSGATSSAWPVAAGPVATGVVASLGAATRRTRR